MMSKATSQKPWTTEDLGVPPRAEEAERAILGAILLDNTALEKVSGRLQPEDFYSTAHQVIYHQMLDLAERGEAIDHVVLVESLRSNNQLGNARGAAYIAELRIETVSTANIASHGKLVMEKSRLRQLQFQLVSALTEIERGADLDRVVPLLPDTVMIEEASTSGINGLPVVSAAQLLEVEETDSLNEWIVKFLIAVGAFVGLIGKPKTGKTTWIYELAVKVALGQMFMGFTTMRSAVLILAVEEHERDIRRRLRSLGAENVETLHLMIGALDANHSTFAKLKKTIETLSIRLVIIDTLNSIWTVEDENDAAQVTRAVKPFLELARSTGAAIVALHHARKSEGEYGDEIRGSGALFSLLDAAFILKRHDVDIQRKLTAISRWPETPPELILELRDHGYECLGDASTAGRIARLQKLKAALTSESQTAKELATRAGIPLRAAHTLIDDLVRDGHASREGSGRKGTPFKFVACSIERGPA